MTAYENLPEWPYVYGAPSGQGSIRQQPEDFIVKEQLSFIPSGAGEHVFLQIEKTGENTDYVARQLARVANVRQRDIGYAGIKDRHAVTTQWFSVWLPGLNPEPDWQGLANANINVLQTIRHARKLKRGVLSGNHFKLLIRGWQGDKATTLHQLEAIKIHGIANYYGPQRFGNGGQNVTKALAMFQGQKTSREHRSLYLSAARSYLFNEILAQRVSDRTWNQALAGDIYRFDLSNSQFSAEPADSDMLRRLASNAIHPTGALWGKDTNSVTDQTLAIEQTVIEAHPELANGLIAAAVAMDRRTLRVNVQDLRWQFGERGLELEFGLPPGSYATSVLREIVAVTKV